MELEVKIELIFFIIFSTAILYGGDGKNHQKYNRVAVVPRVPEFEEETLVWRDVGS